jgi:uncharacterized repeat protein (TIGR01451 family)
MRIGGINEKKQASKRGGIPIMKHWIWRKRAASARTRGGRQVHLLSLITGVSLVLGAGAAAAAVIAHGTTLGRHAPARSAALTAREQFSNTRTLTKEADTRTFAGAGEEIVYTFTVRNNAHLIPAALVTVSDPRLSRLPVCVFVQPILGGQTRSCTFDYRTTAADVAAGRITDVATARAAAIFPPTRSNEVVVRYAPSTPAIGLSKIANPESFAMAGDTITYTYTVTNNGNVPLALIRVTDTVNGQTHLRVTCGLSTLFLLPGRSTTCRATYETTQADVNRGSVTNSAVATARTVPAGEPVTSETASLTVDAEVEQNISIAKSASVDSFNQAGTEITYFYDVENNGNTTLTHVHVTDSRGLHVECPDGTTLEPGESIYCLAVYRTTQTDVNNGEVIDLATAVGADPHGTVTDTTQPLIIPAVHAPGISIVKTASTGDFTWPGTKVTYFYEVTNTGNVTLTSVSVTDSVLGRITCPLTTLAPGEHMVCTATRWTTAADVANGSLTNGATVTARTPSGEEVTAGTEEVLPVSPIPAPESPLLPAVSVTA